MSAKEKNNKYVLYFYCTPYKKSSAGVKTIYHIIDFYNKNNQPAFIIFQNETIGSKGYSNSYVPNDMQVPNLTKKLIDEHIKKSLIPIVIYPDTVSGNPLNAENICRLILYYDGILTKKTSLNNSKNEGLLYFSYSIKERASISNSLYEKIISLPVAEPEIVDSSLPLNKERTDEYYYDGKFVSNFNGIIPDDIKKLKKIDRGLNDSLQQNEIFEKLKSAKILHVFEDTALIYEALLLGCPVNIHPDGYFYKKKPLSNHEVKLYGSISKRNINKKDILNAREQIQKFKKEYNQWIINGENSLNDLKRNFIKHNGKYTQNNIKKIKNNITVSDQYFKEIVEKKKYQKNKKIFSLAFKVLIRFLFFCYKLSQKKRFLGNKIIKFLVYRIFYHILPTFLKRKISMIIQDK